MKKRHMAAVKRPPSKIDINYVAKLANLSLSPAEKEIFEKQLGEVLKYINHLGKVNTEKTEPVGQITNLVNVSRDDNPAPSITQEEALANAPRTRNGFFEVDAIFDSQ